VRGQQEVAGEGPVRDSAPLAVSEHVQMVFGAYPTTAATRFGGVPLSWLQRPHRRTGPLGDVRVHG
jgi:hypothetical protein